MTPPAPAAEPSETMQLDAQLDAQQAESEMDLAKFYYEATEPSRIATQVRNTEAPTFF